MLKRKRYNERRDDALQAMLRTMRDVTNSIIEKRMVSIKFQAAYCVVYRATALFKCRVEWKREVERSAEALAFALRHDEVQFNEACAMVRDVSLYPERLHFLNRETVADVFGRAWKEWHGDRERRAWVLWRAVRAKRASLAALATLEALYEEASLRPGNSRFQKTMAHFQACVRECARV